jgi:hypothetical protein
MVINTNISGAANNTITDAVNRPNSRAKSNSPSGNSGVPGWNTLAAQVNETLSQEGVDDTDGAAATQTAGFVRSGFLSQPATAMFAQANFSPDMVMSLLQG